MTRELDSFMKGSGPKCVGCECQLDTEDILRTDRIGEGREIAELHCCEECEPIVVRVLQHIVGLYDTN